MKSSLKFNLSITREIEGDLVGSFPFEVVCVYGRPSGDPESTNEIPLMIKEIIIDGKPAPWEVRELLIEHLGGEEALCDLLK